MTKDELNSTIILR